jgi:hypothetical protein
MTKDHGQAEASPLKVALLYFGFVFGAGFMLGPIRILWLVPRIGVRAAELIETPIMVLVTVFAARWLIRQYNVPPAFATRAGIGLVALSFMVIAEVALGYALRGASLSEYITNRDPVSGTVYVVALGLFAFMPVLVLQRETRASREERLRSLPGDELIPEPLGSLTQAITIQRSPDAIWPWLAQMGAGNRAGWYSYDFVDNGGKRSAERIIPELQNLAIGMLFPALPRVTDGFNVLRYDPGSSLVLGWLPSADDPPIVTWAFVLEETKDQKTRLLVRARGAQNYDFHRLPMWLVRLGHFMMQRKQLIGIARRAEQQRVPSSAEWDTHSIRTSGRSVIANSGGTA